LVVGAIARISTKTANPIALGAYDFYQKPIDIDVLKLIVARAERIFDLEAENRRLLEATAASPDRWDHCD
jgi:DNA-binding NtrC family response regulator